MALPSKVRFGHFELDRKAERLYRAGEPVSLTGHAYRLLDMLLERPGEVITRDEVRERLWPTGEFVDFESGINVTIRRIRELLDSPEGPVHVQTLRGRGYRFEVPVEAVPETPAALPKPAALEQPSVPAPRPVRSFRSFAVAGVLAAAILAAAAFTNMVVRSKNLPGGPMTMELVTRSGVAQGPAISPDGRWMAYTDEDDGQRVLRRCELATQNCSTLLREVGSPRLIFSADARWIYFGTDRGPSPGRNIYRIPAEGGSPNIVVRGVHGLQAISPDGSTIFYLRTNEREDVLYSVPAAGGEERRLLARFRPDRLTQAALSPDGKTLACWWLVTNNGEYHYAIISAPASGGSDNVVSSYRWPFTFPRPAIEWLPDGSGVAVVGVDQETGIRQIYAVTYPGGEVQRVTKDFSTYHTLSIASGSHALLALRDDTAGQIWVSTGGAASPMRQISTGIPGYNQLTWMPNGQLLAVSQGVWQIDPGTGRKERVRGLLATDRDITVSPDGQSLFFTSFRSNATDIWTARVDGSNLRQVTFTGTAGRPALSPDGKWLLYAAFAEDGIALFKMPSNGGEKVRIGAGLLCTEPGVSPDGKWISGLCGDSQSTELRRITVFAFEGGPPQKTFALPGGATTLLKWTPDGAISYWRSKNYIGNVWRQSLDGGAPQQVTQFDAMGIWSVAWANDGRLAVSRASSASDAVLIHNSRNR